MSLMEKIAISKLVSFEWLETSLLSIIVNLW
jgi:hypothetical protein